MLVELQIARLRKGFKQYEVADKLTELGFRVSHSKYSKVEAGTIIPMKAEQVAIAELLGVDVSLIWEDGNDGG